MIKSKTKIIQHGPKIKLQWQIFTLTSVEQMVTMENTPEEVKQDLEGLQIMRGIGQNMAWMIKCIEAGKAAGITYPQTEQKIATNFIR